MSPRVLAIGIAHAPSRSTFRVQRTQNTNTRGPKGLRAKILAQTSEAKAAGFNLEIMQIKHSETDATLAKLREKLSKEEPDLFIVGFGIRGTVEYTELFESLVNICREASPGTRIGFNKSLDDTLTVCRRMARLEEGAKSFPQESA